MPRDPKFASARATLHRRHSSRRTAICFALCIGKACIGWLVGMLSTVIALSVVGLVPAVGGHPYTASSRYGTGLLKHETVTCSGRSRVGVPAAGWKIVCVVDFERNNAPESSS